MHLKYVAITLTYGRLMESNEESIPGRHLQRVFMAQQTH